MPKRNFIGNVSEHGIVYGITQMNTLIVKDGMFANERHIVIPEKVHGMLVVGVDDSAFQNSAKIRSISLPPTATEVGHNAFSGCVNLKNVKMYASTVYLGNNAFAYCHSLMRVEGNDIVTTSDRAFWKCVNLTNIYANFKGEVFAQTFGGCSMLKDITFLNVKLHEKLFWGCKQLTTLYFNGAVEMPEDVLHDVVRRKIVCPPNSPLVELGYDGVPIIIKDK